MPPDSTKTKERLLAAALDEFSRHGLAGARVDRIAASARANKQAIYAHFGNKDALFDLVIDEHVKALVDAVPFTPEDLPGYATAVHDHLVEHPRLIRLTMWRYLERGDAEKPEELGDAKVRAISEAQRDGLLPETATAADVLAVVLSIATTWTLASPTLLGRRADQRRPVEQRGLIRATVAALLADGRGSPACRQRKTQV